MLTVITPAASRRLALLEDVRLDLGLSADSPSNARLVRHLDQVSRRVESLCNRVFGRQIYRERIYLRSLDGFALSASPVNRIIAVSTLGGTLFDDSQYTLSDGMLRLTYGRGLGDGSSYNLNCAMPPVIVVDYEAGWLLPGEEVGDTFFGQTPLPADVENAVIQLIGVAISEAGRDVTIRSENVQGVGSTTYSTQAPGSALPHPGAEAALQPYRNLVLV